MQPKKLATILVEAGLVTRLVIDSTLAKLKRGDALADRLVSDGRVAELDVLQAVSHALGCRFVSSQRLAQTAVGPSTLEFLPAEVARRALVLPLAFEPASRVLAVVAADPLRVAKGEGLEALRRAGQVVIHLALPSAVRAAIGRLYNASPRSTTPRLPVGLCPHCKGPYFENQLECVRCGLLLDGSLRGSEGHDPQLVRALLAVPTGVHRVPSLAQVLEGPTRRGPAVVLDDADGVTLAATIEVMRSLSELEAFMVASLEPAATVRSVIERSGLTPLEGRSVLASLAQRDVVRITKEAVRVTNQPPATVRLAKMSLTRMAPVEGSMKSTEEAATENSLQLALSLERRGEVDGALKVLNIAIARTKRPAPLYNRLALVLAGHRRDFVQAETLLKKAVQLEPENTVYQANLAKVLMQAASRRK